MNTAVASMYPRGEDQMDQHCRGRLALRPDLGGLLTIGLGAVDWRWKVLRPALVTTLIFIGFSSAPGFRSAKGCPPV